MPAFFMRVLVTDVVFTSFAHSTGSQTIGRGVLLGVLVLVGVAV
jgi:hypothetical protein